MTQTSVPVDEPRDEALQSEAKGADFQSFLGPASERYLALGYGKVTRTLSAIQPVDNGGCMSKVEAVASVVYPVDWSSKRGKEHLSPHLSSLDAIILAQELLGEHAAQLGVGRAPVGAVVSASVRAVPSARGHSMASIPVQCTTDRSPGGLTCVCRIGSLEVKLVADQAANSWPTAPSSAPMHWQSNVLERSPTHVTSHHVPPVALRSTASRTESTVLRFVDFLSLTAQAAQILIYTRDGVRREDTDTLWMRRATFTMPQPLPVPSRGLTLQTSLTAERSVRLRGETWRVYEVAASGLSGITAAASLAYREPAERDWQLL